MKLKRVMIKPKFFFWAGGVSQAVEHLLCKHEALSLNYKKKILFLAKKLLLTKKLD
jgi:hypothetical protein